jgi:hypothetical protein
LELVRRQRPADGGLMARPTYVHTIEYTAALIGENLELFHEFASNSDNIDSGQTIHRYDGSEGRDHHLHRTRRREFEGISR